MRPPVRCVVASVVPALAWLATAACRAGRATHARMPRRTAVAVAAAALAGVTKPTRTPAITTRPDGPCRAADSLGYTLVAHTRGRVSVAPRFGRRSDLHLRLCSVFNSPRRTSGRRPVLAGGGFDGIAFGSGATLRSWLPQETDGEMPRPCSHGVRSGLWSSKSGHVLAVRLFPAPRHNKNNTSTPTTCEKGLSSIHCPTSPGVNWAGCHIQGPSRECHN